MKKAPHLVFYDGECGFCDHTVQFLLKADKENQFVFAPLQGKTAQKILKDLPSEYKAEDTLVLVENYNTPEQKFYILGKGTFRILWLLGGFWRLLGWISFFPGFLYNWAYRLVARNRKFFFRNACKMPPSPHPKDRFLE